MKSRPHLIPVLAATLLLSPLQAQNIADPANLTGERVAPQSPADTLEINHGAPALQQLLLKLRTRASMMLIVAHPDDEDGGFLTYESRGQGARVAMLTLTRGEGGQNLMTADFDDALGLIRTQELLAADRYMGVDQFFGTEIDFGFSKTKEEAFAKWTHDRVLYDAVRAVRLYHPLVLASVFVGGPTDGHGHHQVSGEISQEVFKAAADPNVFPEMYLSPWAPLKVYARVPFSRVTPEGMFDYATGRTIPTRFQNYVTGESSTAVPTPTVVIHEGDPALIGFPGHPAAPALGMEGLSYVQFARKGLALQKTQIGPNVRLPSPGRNDSGYTLIATRTSCSGSSPVYTPGPPPGGTPGPSPLGTPSLQARASQSPATDGASSPGVCHPSATESSIFDNIDTSLPGIATLARTNAPAIRRSLEAVDAKVGEAQTLFDPAHLERTAPPLRDALRLLDSLVGDASHNTRDEDLLHELKIKRVQCNNALLVALRLGFSASSPASTVSTSDSSVSFTDTFTNLGTAPVRVDGTGGTAAFMLPPFTRQLELGDPILPPGSSSTDRTTINFLQPPPATRPYFSRKDREQPFYDISDPELRNAPETPAPLVILAWLDAGARLDVAATVQAAQTLDAPGTLTHPLLNTPPISIGVTPALGLITPRDKALYTKVLIQSTTSNSVSGEVHLKPMPHWRVEPSSTQWTATRSGIAASLPFTLSAPTHTTEKSLTFQAIARYRSDDYSESFRPVGYPGLTYTNLYTPATYRAAAVDVTTAPNLRVAYLPGTGDSVPDFLPNLGITPTLLTPADLTPATLAKFDTILLGVRAYSAHPDLNSAALQSFATNGGTVILQYLSGGAPGTATPYPLTLPGDPAHNVVEEAQPVTLLIPHSPLLNWPNKITSADFNNWIEERGHGFASTWDPHFQPLLETHDVDQDPQKGGLLLAPIGKGAYIYCALALYRQLPEGVPGAYRLLANLLSYAKNPHR